METGSITDEYPRGSDEFSRVTAFSDGLFAIAMTLLIVSVSAPVLDQRDSVHELANALGDLQDSFTSFFISFAVIGGMWLQHHRFIGRLTRLDNTLIKLNLAYLAFIAFLPFPTNLIGDYFSNPLAITLYAGNLAVLGSIEALLLVHAHRAGLLARGMTDRGFRHRASHALLPIIFTLISIPVAFLLTSTAAALCWFGGIPVGRAIDRMRPEAAREAGLDERGGPSPS